MISCGENDKSDRYGVPRPVAWPRLPVSVSDSMTEVEGLPVKMFVNPKVTYSQNKTDHQGLTIVYPPEANAEIYFTFIKAKDETERRRIIEARQERISLNLNGLPAMTIHGKGTEGSEAIVVVAKSGTQTPVQLLAEMPGYVVTGTAFLKDPRVSMAYDSIKPLIEVLEYDMTHALKGIKYEQEL